MGFGNGYGARHDRGGKRYSNDMVAHVWAQATGGNGQSGNGNFYFQGADLWSYGTHFLVGRIMADGVALLNADSYSVSTSGHQSDAASAVRHRDKFYIGNLTDFRDVLAYCDSGRQRDSQWKARARRLLVERASDLMRRRNAYKWEADASESTQEEAGAYLARLIGLPSASWGAIKRERERLDAAKVKADKRAAEKRAHDLALRYATMSDSEWRAFMRKDSSKYESFYDRTAKELYHAGRYAKAHKWSAKRCDVLKARRANALMRKAGYDGAEKSYKRWSPVKYQIDMVRSCQRILSGEATAGAGPNGISARTEATRKAASSLAFLSNVAAFSSAARFRMRAEAARLDSLLPALQVELDAFREVEREREQAEYEERMRLNRLAHADKVAAWHDGADVRITFDAESGGAAIRIRGDMLETSHGASVPLAHAVKAFRFVKLMRERGTAWQRNGKTIRVGHFQIDSISANGDFVAGCHKFTWPEVERAAALAGVAEVEADDSAVVSSAAA